MPGFFDLCVRLLTVRARAVLLLLLLFKTVSTVAFYIQCVLAETKNDPLNYGWQLFPFALIERCNQIRV